jgi:outer membrane biosynthesis protein TonB
VKIVRLRNPFPPYPPIPDGFEQREWIKNLEYFRPFVEYVLNSLRESLVAAGAPADLLVSREALNAQDGMIDLISIALAKTRVPTDTFWQEVTPERFSADTILAVFGPAVINQKAAKEVDVAIRVVANRARTELAASGRTGLPPSRPSKAPYVTAPKAPPKPPRPPREKKPKVAAVPRAPSEPPPRAPSEPPPRAPSEPRPSRPPSASFAASREDLPDSDAFHEAMEEQIEEAAEEVAASFPPSAAPFPTDDDAPPRPAPSDMRPTRRRPPSANRVREQLPRVRSLSEATLRSEREYFYSDRDGSLSERACPMDRRLSGFWEYRAGMRPSGYTLPATVLRTYKDDILLMVIPPGNLVQVFCKGALTEVFASSRTENALLIAARYANQWRGVLPDGSIARDAKRSRLKSTIYASYYTAAGISEPVQIGEPITEVLERDPGARGRKLANPAPLSRYLPLSVGDVRALPSTPPADRAGSVVIRIRNPRSR